MCSTTFNALAQDPMFSQPLLGNISINPALAGHDSTARLGVSYRDQWPQMIGEYKTTSINFYQFIPKLNAYGGVNYINDNAGNGIIKTNAISLFYSQNINVGKVLIRPSLEIGFRYKKLDFDKLVFNQYGTRDPGIRETARYLDVNTGAIVYYKNILLGVSAHHLNGPDDAFYGSNIIPVRYGLQAAYTLNFKNISISPFLFYSKQRDFHSRVNGISLLLYNHFNIAISKRWDDAYIYNIGYQSKYFAINYSYDDTISILANLTGGAHEVGLAIKFWDVKTKRRFLPAKSIFS